MGNKPEQGNALEAALASSRYLKLSEVSVTDLRAIAARQVLYAVLDSCDAPEVLAKVTELGPERALCLYRGKLDKALLEVAPYLVQIDDALMSWIATVWHEPWGIFILSGDDVRHIRRNLRKFLVVQSSEGEALLFRFYDPRVLPIFLSSCLPEELIDFFGPVSAFGYVPPNLSGARLVQKSL